MARYKITLAYDGTDFQGFQKQGKARTVQGVFEAALKKLGWRGTSILASGRTDTGVHAAGQVVTFDLEWAHSSVDLSKALNANLPVDTAVRAVEMVLDDFHPRYAARARTYRYTFFCSPYRDPLRERYAWRVWPAVDAQTMLPAADEFPGEADFSAFGAPPKPGGHTVRRIHQVAWLPEPDGWKVEITGNAFLYHMVRRMVHSLVLVGQARLSQEELRQSVQEARPLPPGMAEPSGLVLWRVWYDERQV